MNIESAINDEVGKNSTLMATNSSISVSLDLIRNRESVNICEL